MKKKFSILIGVIATIILVAAILPAKGSTRSDPQMRTASRSCHNYVKFLNEIRSNSKEIFSLSELNQEQKEYIKNELLSSNKENITFLIKEKNINLSQTEDILIITSEFEYQVYKSFWNTSQLTRVVGKSDKSLKSYDIESFKKLNLNGFIDPTKIK